MSIATAAIAAEATPSKLTWRQHDDVPDVVGRKGMYGGVSDGHVLLAGGSNFPVPLRNGGPKTFHRDVFVRGLPLTSAGGWSVVHDALPQPLGEGAAVTTPGGVLAIGGHDGRAPVRTVLLLTWDAAHRTAACHAWPALPEPAANAAAAWHDGWVYVAGGEGGAGPLARFWRIDAAAAADNAAATRWEELPVWPAAGGAPGRFGCILVAVTTSRGPRLLLAGGLSRPPRAEADYLREAALFDPEARTWSAAAPMPRGAVLGTGVPLPDGRGLVLGGSDGHDFARMKELGERYRIPDDVLLYDGASDRWTRPGHMPLGVVGAALVPDGTRWLVAGGEYSPGLRTAAVYELEISGR